jgi:hypothetical protein
MNTFLSLTDLSEPFYLRKKPGFDAITVTMDAAATGVTITVDGNANAIAFNTVSAAGIVPLLEAAKDAAAKYYPIEAKLGHIVRGETFGADYIINDASITMEAGKWEALHLDTSQALQGCVRIAGAPYRCRIMHVGGTFTRSGGTTATTLYVYRENLVKQTSVCVYTEELSTAALSSTQIDNAFFGSEGLITEAGIDYVVKIARATALAACNFGVSVRRLDE